jgi:hypothetical protein
VIVVDYVMRVALANQCLGLKIANKVGTTTRVKIPAKYFSNLDFAEDIMLISDDATNSKKLLDAVDIMALENQQRERNRKKWGVSHRITGFYRYNKSCRRLKVFRILAAKLHKRF